MDEAALKTIMESLDSMKQSFKESIDTVNKRVDDLTSERASSTTPSPRRKPGTECPTGSAETESSRSRTAHPKKLPSNWADRTESGT